VLLYSVFLVPFFLSPRAILSLMPVPYPLSRYLFRLWISESFTVFFLCRTFPPSVFLCLSFPYRFKIAKSLITPKRALTNVPLDFRTPHRLQRAIRPTSSKPESSAPLPLILWLSCHPLLSSWTSAFRCLAWTCYLQSCAVCVVMMGCEVNGEKKLPFQSPNSHGALVSRSSSVI
jgi:hypothetical protein